MTQEPMFRETQRMRQPWTWVFLGLVSVPSLAFGSIVALLITLVVAGLFYLGC